MKKLPLIVTLIATIASIFIFSGCNKKVTRYDDYGIYLQGKNPDSKLSKIDGEISFWKKRFTTTPDDIIARTQIAGLFTQRFLYSGNVRELHAADSLYQLVNQLNRINSSSTYRALAANCITMHQFRQAGLYIDSALALGDNKYLSILMEIDIAMETGKKQSARNALQSIVDKKSFDWLIREAKYKDHAEGDLDAAIKLMEQALETVQKEKNLSAWLWAKSNLGDMYGHANRFDKSYQSYLDVLAIDPAYYHALKGIAWLAFSKDKDFKAAKEIIQFLQSNHPVPDYDLMLSEIARASNDHTEKTRLQDKFVDEVNNLMYGDMYNKYLFTLLADDRADEKAALALAEKEVINRPTGEVYSWLAYAYMKNGQNEKALKTARYHVEKSCFEPDALLYLAKIYQANGNNGKARKFLDEAWESRYELGPSAAREITDLIKQL